MFWKSFSAAIIIRLPLPSAPKCQLHHFPLLPLYAVGGIKFSRFFTNPQRRLPMPTSKIPQGFASVTPYLVVKGAAEAIKLYGQAFGAKEQYRMECPSGSGQIMHACIEVGNSKLF